MCHVAKIHYEHVQSHETQTVIAQQTNIRVDRKAVRTFFLKKKWSGNLKKYVHLGKFLAWLLTGA